VLPAFLVTTERLALTARSVLPVLPVLPVSRERTEPLVFQVTTAKTGSMARSGQLAPLVLPVPRVSRVMPVLPVTLEPTVSLVLPVPRVSRVSQALTASQAFLVTLEPTVSLVSMARSDLLVLLARSVPPDLLVLTELPVKTEPLARTG